MNFSLTWLSRDGKLLLTVRILRTFGYGFLSVIIAIYLKLLGFDDIQIGLLLGSALVNSVIFTLFASFYADRIGRRRLLIIYASLMSVSGLIFTFTDNYLMLILAAFIGIINVTGSETGAFLTIEQAILPQTIKDKKNDEYNICTLQYGRNVCHVCRHLTVWFTISLTISLLWVKSS
jgi:Arabinose efflux permease